LVRKALRLGAVTFFWFFQETGEAIALEGSVLPNIVLILTDDQRWDTLQYMPTVQAELVNKGVTFTNAYATTPMCCPSRASILTGLYARNHGVLRNFFPNGGATVFRDASTLAAWLEDAGYRTALIGKYLNEYHKISPDIPPGWTDWRVFVVDLYYDYDLNENGDIVSYGVTDADYSTDVLKDKAVKFIQSASAGQPFFLYFSPYAPHRPATPAARHDGLYGSLSPWSPPSFNEEDVSDKPQWVQELALIGPTNQGILESLRQDQLESLQAVDEAVAAILKAIQDFSTIENTLIIFSSDNGLTWGEHRLDFTKGCGYEECLHVPMVVRYDDWIAIPRQDDRFVLNIDLAPTIADLGGAAVPSAVDGQSLVPLLNGSASTWRADFLFEYWLDEQEENGLNSYIPEYAGVRTEDYKYVEYATGEKELYDETADPYELVNLSGDPAYASIEADLSRRLTELKTGQTDPPPGQANSGSAEDSSDNPFCFIATAAYGSPLEPHVQWLRDVRDRYLRTTMVGRKLIRFYERHSPPLAQFISQYDALQAVTRLVLLPVIGLAWWLLETTVLTRMATLVLLIGLVLLYIVRIQNRRMVL
jgi:arylsulfatase A-like enzyme